MTDQARDSLSAALKRIEFDLPNENGGNVGREWHEWLMAHVLLREAREANIQVAQTTKGESH